MRSLSALFDLCLTADYTHLDDTSYALLREGAALTILFEPSNGDEDWRRNLDFKACLYRETSEGFHVHRGFLEAWKAVLPVLSPLVFDESIRRVTIVGYSHGGALTLLCHDYIWFMRPDLRKFLEGVAFASPKVVRERRPPSWLTERFSHFWTVVNAGDVVTSLPPSFLGYTHMGRVLRIGEKGSYGAIEAHRAENYQNELFRAGL